MTYGVVNGQHLREIPDYAYIDGKARKIYGWKIDGDNKLYLNERKSHY